MDAIIGTILIVLFDILIIGVFIASLLYANISWIIPTIIFVAVAIAMYKPNKEVLKWWINKL